MAAFLHITLASKSTLTWLLSQTTALHRSRVSCVRDVCVLQGLPLFCGPAGPALPTPPDLSPPSPSLALCFSCLQTQILPSHLLHFCLVFTKLFIILCLFILVFHSSSALSPAGLWSPQPDQKLQGTPLIKFARPCQITETASFTASFTPRSAELDLNLLSSI